MMFVPIVVLWLVALAAPILIHRRAIRRLREFMRRAGWEVGEYDWFMSMTSARWNGRPVSFSRMRKRTRIRLEQPSTVTLQVTRKSDLLVRLNDAFRADAIEIQSSAFRFYGDGAELARVLSADDEIALAMHEVLRGGGELIIDREGIAIETRSFWDDTPDAAWRLIVAIDRLLTPERRAP
jgi:hypothetical protein